MTRIGILYKVEELIKDKAPEERYQERQKQSRPIVDALFEWLHSMEDSVDRSSLIGDRLIHSYKRKISKSFIDLLIIGTFPFAYIINSTLNPSNSIGLKFRKHFL